MRDTKTISELINFLQNVRRFTGDDISVYYENDCEINYAEYLSEFDEEGKRIGIRIVLK